LVTVDADGGAVLRVRADDQGALVERDRGPK
jgi:hypothetical protein